MRTFADFCTSENQLFLPLTFYEITFTFPFQKTSEAFHELCMFNTPVKLKVLAHLRNVLHAGPATFTVCKSRVVVASWMWFGSPKGQIFLSARLIKPKVHSWGCSQSFTGNTIKNVYTEQELFQPVRK